MYERLYHSTFQTSNHHPRGIIRARMIQTVSKKKKSTLLEPINEFKTKPDTALLVNSSFNVRGEAYCAHTDDASVVYHAYRNGCPRGG